MYNALSRWIASQLRKADKKEATDYGEDSYPFGSYAYRAGYRQALNDVKQFLSLE